MLPRNQWTLQTTLPEFLSKQGLRFEAVVVGGTALNLLGVVARATKDCDVLVPEVPEDVDKAARAFAAACRAAGQVLGDDWFNNEPRSFAARACGSTRPGAPTS
jgi:hypothetical protein